MSDGIRINGVAPGLIKTKMSSAILNAAPPQAIGFPENIAAMVSTVCSPKDGAFMNGEIYYLHGGFPKMWFYFESILGIYLAN